VSGYHGDVDEDRVRDLVRELGALFVDAGEVGFVLTYHAVDEPGSGRMELAGSGISQGQLEGLLAEALERNRTENRTA